MMVYKFSQYINECPNQIAKGLDKLIFHLAKSLKLVPKITFHIVIVAVRTLFHVGGSNRAEVVNRNG